MRGASTGGNPESFAKGRLSRALRRAGVASALALIFIAAGGAHAQTAPATKEPLSGARPPVLQPVPSPAPAPQPPSLDQLPATNLPPVRDEEFSLDLDEGLNVGVAWPDLNAKDPGDQVALPPAPPEEPMNADATGTPPATQTAGTDAPDVAPQETPAEQHIADDGSERRYRVVLNGLDTVAVDGFRTRFNSFSLLEEGKGKAANIAQINRRMKADSDLIERILRADGYYDARIRPSVLPPDNGANGKLRITFDIRAGTRYTLKSVDLPGLAEAAGRAPSLRTAFPVNVGDPVDADDITAARTQLAVALGETGFPFAKVQEPEVTIDHEIQQGDLVVAVAPGGYRTFGNIVLDPTSRRVFTARHLTRIARFDRGDVFQVSDVEDLRRAIVATGLVSSATVKPQDAGDGEHADIAVSLAPAKMRTIAGEIGYGTGEGARVEASWQHRNFFPPEGSITVRGLLGTREQAAGVSYRKNNFLRRDNVLSSAIAIRKQRFNAYDASTISLTAGIERQSNIIYHKKWSWSAGIEILGSRERAFYDNSITATNRDYLIVALPVSVTYDSTDDWLDPKKGFRLGGRLSPEAARQNGNFTYTRTQVDGSVYVPFGEKIVVASRVRLGSILGGVSSDRIAPTRRYYAGGGASVRGYGYQAIGPRDPDNDPVGGKSLAEFSLEARIRFGTFGVVPFIDAGNISTGFLPRLDNVRVGAGVGLRYYSSFGPIRIDVGTPINPQKGDGRIAVYVSLGQAF